MFENSLTICHCSHQHKNTIQALAWSPNGNLVASASRDQTVRVFDIRAMKEFRILKGHKKEVCCTSLPHAHSCSLTHADLLFANSRHLASRPPDPRLRRLRRRHPPLGPRRPRTHPTPTRPPPARDALPSTRLQRLGPHLPPTRTHPGECLQRPHDALLVPRTTGRCELRVCRGRREAARGDGCEWAGGRGGRDGPWV